MKRILLLLILFTPIIFLMVQCNVIWTSPKTYNPKQVTLRPPIISLDEYSASGLINTHARPYIYIAKPKNSKGAVLVFGAEHTHNPDDKQFSLLKQKWIDFNPTVAMVEGRLGYLFIWTQDPVKKLGEGGYTAKLAKAKGAKLFSWEPGRDAEVDFLLSKYDAFHVAAFFCFRPYLNKYEDLPKTEQDKIMRNLISERTRHKGISGTITSIDQLDSLWKSDYPIETNWRTYKHPQNGWPEGKFKQIAEETNSLRDIHMCNSIFELVNKGERVFISMGSSHAPRIEGTLRGMLE